MGDRYEREGATPRKFTHGAKIIKRPAGKRTSALDRFWPRAAIDDSAGIGQPYSGLQKADIQEPLSSSYARGRRLH